MLIHEAWDIINPDKLGIDFPAGMAEEIDVFECKKAHVLLDSTWTFGVIVLCLGVIIGIVISPGVGGSS